MGLCVITKIPFLQNYSEARACHFTWKIRIYYVFSSVDFLQFITMCITSHSSTLNFIINYFNIPLLGHIGPFLEFFTIGPHLH